MHHVHKHYLKGCPICSLIYVDKLHQILFWAGCSWTLSLTYYFPCLLSNHVTYIHPPPPSCPLPSKVRPTEMVATEPTGNSTRKSMADKQRDMSSKAISVSAQFQKHASPVNIWKPTSFSSTGSKKTSDLKMIWHPSKNALHYQFAVFRERQGADIL